MDLKLYFKGYTDNLEGNHREYIFMKTANIDNYHEVIKNIVNNSDGESGATLLYVCIAETDLIYLTAESYYMFNRDRL